MYPQTIQLEEIGKGKGWTMKKVERYIIRSWYSNGGADLYLIVEHDDICVIEQIIQDVHNDTFGDLDDLCNALNERGIKYYPVDDYLYF